MSEPTYTLSHDEALVVLDRLRMERSSSNVNNLFDYLNSLGTLQADPAPAVPTTEATATEPAAAPAAAEGVVPSSGASSAASSPTEPAPAAPDHTV